ncbi:BgTH12-01549 [Blumeria graminis f. sp. triticale]|uniref:BgTH12-01549 n=1 Tax=Blumeria graminis f. sp. triticale TaxID=1689686 RepID=A0A9W4CZN8_BLUGR|nr:BgTH12-01549 [Blumeria graminis f. sp. triticale]
MKPTRALTKKISRLALTTKQTNKGFYKGTGSGSMGDHTKHGGFIINWEKVRTYVPPTKDLKDYKLTPFVTKKIWAPKGRFNDSKGPLSGELYLARWKAENGSD